jgi:hypothetical protein
MTMVNIYTFFVLTLFPVTGEYEITSHGATSCYMAQAQLAAQHAARGYDATEAIILHECLGVTDMELEALHEVAER